MRKLACVNLRILRKHASKWVLLRKTGIDCVSMRKNAYYPINHFLVSMLMHLYTAGALLASRQPNICSTSCVVWLPSFKLISLNGEMRPPCVAGAAPIGEELQNVTSTPCTIILEYRSAFLV